MPLRPHLPVLTTLRFFTVLFVFLFHLEASNIHYTPNLAQWGGSIGFVGVNWFFVLSGFILTYTYAGRNRSRSEIWGARFARVYPVYFVSLCLTAPLFIYVCFNHAQVPENAWLITMREHLVLFTALSFLLLQAWVPTAALSVNLVGWSLSVEAFFYFLFPLILPLFERLTSRQLALVMGNLAALSILVASLYGVFGPDGVTHVTYNTNHLPWLNVLRFNPIVRLPEFIIGICGALLFLRHQFPNRYATPLMLFGAFTIGVTVLYSDQIAYPILHNGLLSLPFLALIYGVALRPRWISVLERRPFQLLGELSYCFFLVHAVIIVAYFRPNGVIAQQRSLLDVLLCLFLGIALSFTLYQVVEKPMRRWLTPVRGH